MRAWPPHRPGKWLQRPLRPQDSAVGKAVMEPRGKSRLSLARIVELNLGFFGLQLSFGLLVANTSPIFRSLGAEESELPLLWIAGPVTGMLVQPLVGALSDRTTSRFGRRTPFLAAGSVLAAASLLAMPLAPALWVAVALLWVLDTANNLALEPYRATVADRLPPDQLPRGFLVQSAFTGAAQTLAYLLPWALAALIDHRLVDANGIPLTVRIAFGAGAVITLSTILYSLLRVPEPSLSPSEREALVRLPRRPLLAEIWTALRTMPAPMRRLALPMLCQWYAMFVYWQFWLDAIARHLMGTRDPASDAYREAILLTQQLGTLYNAIAFVAALALIPLLRRWPIRTVHATCLALSGLSMLLLAEARSPTSLALAMVGIGIGWAALMGNNHALLARCLPAHRIGIYMGLFNLFIVLPMIAETVTMPLLYRHLLGSDPSQAIVMAGFIMMAGGLAIFLSGNASVSAFLRQNRKK